MKAISKIYVVIVPIFITSIMSGCGTSLNISQKYIGVLHMDSFYSMSTSKGYRMDCYKEYYDHKLIGWNKFGALPYYGVFDENDLLVEYLDYSIISKLGWGICKNPEKVKSIRLAKAKALRAEQEKRSKELQAELGEIK